MTAAVRLFVTREIALRARCLPKPRESSEIHRPTLPSSPDCRHIAGMIAVPVTCSVSGLAPVCLGRDMLRTGRWSPVADGRHTRHPALGEVKIVHGSACPLDGFDDWTRFDLHCWELLIFYLLGGHRLTWSIRSSFFGTIFWAFGSLIFRDFQVGQFEHRCEQADRLRAGLLAGTADSHFCALLRECLNLT